MARQDEPPEGQDGPQSSRRDRIGTLHGRCPRGPSLRRLTLPPLLGLLVLGLLTASRPLPAAAPPVVGTTASLAAATCVSVPPGARRAQPVRALVALHGMGGDGPGFGRDLLAAAAEHTWIVVAPTFAYRDYLNPALVREDDATFLPALAAILDGLPARLGLAVRPRVLLYGFSRGAQTAHRFATVYPERVRGVAALSAASYTVPSGVAADTGQPLPFPYGVADLRAIFGRPFDLAAFRHVPFLIAVGSLDTAAADVPRAWDPYLGRDRVARATAYVRAVRAVGGQATLRIDPGGDHEVRPATRDAALAFLRAAASPDEGQVTSCRDAACVSDASPQHQGPYRLALIRIRPFPCGSARCQPAATPS
jgi:pimeloyl-ACP methyl ester carboxylesterase